MKEMNNAGRKIEKFRQSYKKGPSHEEKNQRGVSGN